MLQYEEVKIKIKSIHSGEAVERAAVVDLAIHITRSTKIHTPLKQEILVWKENENTNILVMSMNLQRKLTQSVPTLLYW